MTLKPNILAADKRFELIKVVHFFLNAP